jgi:DNA-binding response OmpR family regulator
MGGCVKKILIVDDEKSFLLSLKDGLSTHSDKFQILTAENGREAVSILRSVPIDLLVTDLKLPEMNGFELLAWTSRHKPQLPVIVMSAFGTPEIEARLAKMDTLQFLEKPLDIQMLEEGIFNGLNTGGKSFIRGISLATFLQLMKVEKKNCTLKIKHSDQFAYLYVRRGELIDAEFNTLSGLEAALEIVSWGDAEIEMDGICRRQDDVINMPMEHLLIDAFKRKDEAAELANSGLEDVDERVNGFLDGLSGEENSAAAAEKEFGKEQFNKDQFSEDEFTEDEFSEDQFGEDEFYEADAPAIAAFEDKLLQRLAEILAKLSPVVEFAIFDKNSVVLKKAPGECSLATIAPGDFDHFLGLLAEDLSLGPYRSVVFNSTSRSRYLLFHHEQYCVLVKLKSGTQAQQIIKEIDRWINH